MFIKRSLWKFKGKPLLRGYYQSIVSAQAVAETREKRTYSTMTPHGAFCYEREGNMASIPFEPLDENDPIVRKMESQQLWFQKYIKSIPDGYVLPAYYREFQKTNTFTPREDDIWIVTFPRSGTTWTQELTWCIVNIDKIEDARKLPLWFRTPFYEWDCMVPPDGLPDLSKLVIPFDTIEEADKHFQKPGNMVPHLESLPSPRVIKTHLPVSLLPPEARKNKACKAWDCMVPPDGLPDLSKLVIPFDTIEEADRHFQKPGNMIIYVARNPKDSWVSFYHLNRSFENFVGTMDDFIEQHIKGIVISELTPSPSHRHVESSLETCPRTLENEERAECLLPHFRILEKGMSEETNLLLPLRELSATDPNRQNVDEAIEKIARFLGKDLTQEQLKAVKEEASIERMREKAPVTGDNYRWKNLLGEDSTKPFVRDGQVGGWRNELTEEQIEKIDKYIQDYFEEMGLYDTQK
ncbi:unnamed protein product [Darwinula stevensoni]|uniref:Sulfotransferase domain-containing protein n=1 Tax=Darwinula stevensoni TaxID=69355 RepID=A0A7R8XHF8_9CRUS|nr:unnamed protein product [Darwinula stevensoni]CAG0893461.1 unnamed protein product [Darwinula stevensoni]